MTKRTSLAFSFSDFLYYMLFVRHLEPLGPLPSLSSTRCRAPSFFRLYARIACWSVRSSIAASAFQQSAADDERPLAVPRYEWERKAQFLYVRHSASGISIAERISRALQKCTITAIRSCVEWEPEVLPLVPALLGKPVVPIGLLLPSPDGGRGASTKGEEDSTLRWLDAQPPSSVVYVALGTEVPLCVEQVHELALGLELAGTRFLWALRKPSGVLDADILPPCFRERTQERGLVTMAWVPQLSILAHAAAGAFLTHCGRSSLIEGILYGLPLIMLPIMVDQGPNARLMEGKKVGLQVPRNENDGSFDREGVAKAVRGVMMEEEARTGFVANALKMQKAVADQELHERYIDEFVQRLRSHAGDAPCRATSLDLLELFSENLFVYRIRNCASSGKLQAVVREER